MINDLSILFFLVISSGIGIFTSVVLIMLYIRQNQANARLQEKYDQLWERVLLHAEALIKKAHNQAIKIIDESELVSAEMKQHIREALAAAEQRESEEYQVAMKQIQQKITSTSLQQLDEFTDKLIIETKKNEESLEKKSLAVQAELEKYLAERKSQIDAQLERQIFVVIQTVLEKVTGQLLSQDQQEQLILEALHQAQQKHVF